jgi:glycosyltransferase involved in cell wall biosynthesis
VHWITILLSHMTIAVSEGMRSEMTLPFTKRKMVVVHLGRSIANMRYREDARGMLEMKVTDTRARLIDYHDDFWLGTIAELHPIKRLNRAITAVSVLVKEFPGLRFVIVHDGSERENLTEQVRDLGLEEHVFFTGTVEEAARLLPAFDLFVLPSKSEAFGYVLIEAGLAGVPVVATRVGGIPDIITSEENGLLVPPDNTPALTEALRRMIADEELRLKLARAHQDKARTFTLEKMVAETQRVYEI